MLHLEQDHCYRMPVVFGGYKFVEQENAYHDVTTLSIRYVTDGALLTPHIPAGLELLLPELCINFVQCREVDWMAGSAYNLIDVSVPVRFHDSHGDVDGGFGFVVWENRTAPILTGREETGVPKIFADIEDLHRFGDNYFTTASLEGNAFLRLEFTAEKELAGADLDPLRETEINAINYRYIPKVGAPGADLEQLILFPQRSVKNQAWSGTGTVKWTALDWTQAPVQFHIIQALAALPILEMKPATLSKGATYLMASRARVLA